MAQNPSRRNFCHIAEIFIFPYPEFYSKHILHSSFFDIWAASWRSFMGGAPPPWSSNTSNYHLSIWHDIFWDQYMEISKNHQYWPIFKIFGFCYFACECKTARHVSIFWLRTTNAVKNLVSKNNFHIGYIMISSQIFLGVSLWLLTWTDKEKFHGLEGGY